MGWRMIGKPIATAEMVGVPTISQRFKMNRDDEEHPYLKAVVVGVIFYNDPAFTNLYCEVWSDRAGSPLVLLGTTETVSKALCLTTEDHAYKTIGLQFTQAKLLHGDTYYHLVLRASGYTGTDASHIAWRHSYPDPQYQEGVTLSTAKAAKYPFEVSFVAKEVR